MSFDQILNPQNGVPNPNQPQAMQGLGLAPQMADMPDIQAPVPATPEEAEQRKGAWTQVLERVNTDPNLRRAMMVMGLSMMRPGANLGSSGLAGLSAYEMGRMADQTQAKEARQEARTQEQHDETLTTSRSAREWNAQVKPLELQRIRAEIDAIPDEAMRRELELTVARIEAENAPAMAKARLAQLAAQIRASDRTGAAAIRQTDMQRMAEAIKAQLIAQGTDPLAAEAEAWRQATTQRVAAGGDVKTAEFERNARALYSAYKDFGPDSPEVRMMRQTDPEQYALYEYGRRLSLGGPVTPPPLEMPGGRTSAAPTQRVISAADIRKGQTGAPAKPATEPSTKPSFGSFPLPDVSPSTMFEKPANRADTAGGRFSGALDAQTQELTDRGVSMSYAELLDWQRQHRALLAVNPQAQRVLDDLLRAKRGE